MSHASAKRECERAHVSDAVPTCESKFASAKLENTREYSQSYSQSFAWATIYVGVSRNRINKVWCTCGMATEESLYQETRCHDYITTSICLPSSFFTNEEKKMEKNRPPAR